MKKVERIGQKVEHLSFLKVEQVVQRWYSSSVPPKQIENQIDTSCWNRWNTVLYINYKNTKIAYKAYINKYAKHAKREIFRAREEAYLCTTIK